MGFYRETILPWIVDAASGGPELRRMRADVLRDVRGRVLEIGFGTGISLSAYPPAVRALDVVEPSRGMSRRAAKRVARWGGTVRVHAGAGETLPFAAHAFDSVVIALTLCSVADPVRVLAETRRVLVSGGALHFLEHVASHDAAWRRRQDRMNGLQNVLGGGCNLNRDTEGAIAAAGFRFDRIERGLIGGTAAWMAELFPIVWGRAIAP